MKKKVKVAIAIYSIMFALAIKGIVCAKDNITPSELSCLELGHSIVKVFAYGSLEITTTFIGLLPKEIIAQTDSFFCVDLSGSALSLMQISRMQPLPESEIGYTAPGFETMNYYYRARYIGMINGMYNVNTPREKLILPYYKSNTEKSPKR